MLVHNNNSVCGMITADMINGNFVAIQCKSIILADGGFEDVFTNGKANLGMDLALQAGIPLRDMEFISKSPLSVKGTDMILPHGLLSSGASLHRVDGTDIEGDSILEICHEVSQYDTVVLDARNMGDQTKWWNSILRNVKKRTGIDLSKQTIAVENQVNVTIGGLPIDEFGRVVTGSWSRWFTGLYAAGEASCSGLHGAAIIDGNRLLDSLVGGKMSGEHAGEWSNKASFSGTELINKAFDSVNSNFQSLFSEDDSKGAVVRIGSVSSKLREIGLKFVNGENDSSSYQQYLESLEQLSILAETIHVDQESLIANTNFQSILQVQAGIRLLTCSIQSSLARNESRGLHQRSDFINQDDELLHHITIDGKNNVGILALRKSQTGNWILPPQ
jgi:succinate dehydrogenase/fumarate reductase flavoprotein subunit